MTNALEQDKIQDSSHDPQSTQQSREAARRQQKQQLAANSLRKRLKAELQPDMSAEGHHRTQMAQHSHNNAPRGGSGKSSRGKSLDNVPTSGIQRVPMKWNNENPFQASGGRITKRSNGFEAITEYKVPHFSLEDSSAGPDGSDDFAKVALANVPVTRSIHPNRGSGPRPSKESTSTGVVHTESATNGSKDESGGSSGYDGLPVVVANAECELEHPRPSRSSERERIKVLCGEGVEGSGGSSASYHTAPTTNTSGF